MSSFTKGVSFHHETNASSQPNINNNITINASSQVSDGVERSSIDVDPPVGLAGDSNGSVEKSSSPLGERSFQSENEFLKKVLAIYMSQKFYFSGKYIVLTPNELIELIEILLPGKEVEIAAADDDVDCCGFKDAPLLKVESIWVSDNGQKQQFKYGYSNLVALFEDYHISIKFIRSV